MQETRDRLLSLREVEEILGLGRTTLYRMSISGELCPRKIHRRLGYLETEVQLYLKSLPVAGPKPSDAGGMGVSAGQELSPKG